ncbi:MAG: GNAT family N-acetyltransferase [Chitinophagales bacterium]|nr:GNAT family N-acetyltransferase [Chitinophagales bacterium]
MAHSIRKFTTGTADYHQALQLRTEVLRKPLGLEFTAAELEKDDADTHFGLFENDKILACLTLTETPAARMKMRQVAVESASQGRGLGRQLSAAAEEYAHKKGFKVMFCHARKVAAPFYLSMGYQIVGAEFSEIGIPHYLMEKKLS